MSRERGWTRDATTVVVEHGDIGAALKRLRRTTDAVRAELRRREHHVPPGAARRAKQRAARVKALKRRKKLESEGG